MPGPLPSPAFAVIILAAGQGERARQGMPKQFARFRGRPVLRHSVDSFTRIGARQIVVVVPSGLHYEAQRAAGSDAVTFVTGGATRQMSVASGLGAIDVDVPAILIHDAARPDIPLAVVERLLGALPAHDGAIPVLPVIDSLAVADGGRMTGTAPREQLRRVQTPQAFRAGSIRRAHAAWTGSPNAGDDAQVLLAAGGTVAMVEGDQALHKLTYAEDFAAAPPVRTGTGFDVHRLAEGEELWLGGIRIPHDRGLAGHSDADVALHAITDAILGAIGNGDIGAHFPPSDPRWRGASSDQFLAHAVFLAAEAGYRIGNVDLTIICEAPKIGPHRDAMRARIAELAMVDIGQVSVKATTTEGLGFTGRGEGIAAQAAATLLLN
ncbi:bifunctional 2-C-methyl-D-erythritol 4-phosphate cytidylyltransferase/2-C-methyl-D-erythritol 2,4-cyclodiphosphate synthase [Qipengyuania sp.]|uniref:bifunctional 2-C-methyl-D-erythritol 4-phosphate cytidylyltransferase/2-C-methyl-D-erythritol 2,4-cyclodiphosphate synthase n=1 Tax=Qipengyuania sp. TaxID=2004515 RepID=UPI003734D0F8